MAAGYLHKMTAREGSQIHFSMSSYTFVPIPERFADVSGINMFTLSPFLFLFPFLQA